MNDARSVAGVTELNGYIYLAGDSSGFVTDAFELLDPDKDEWIQLSSMKVGRSGCTLIVGPRYVHGYDMKY